MACHGLSFRYSLRDGGNIFRGYDYAPLGCSDTIQVLHLEMGAVAGVRGL